MAKIKITKRQSNNKSESYKWGDNLNSAAITPGDAFQTTYVTDSFNPLASNPSYSGITLPEATIRPEGQSNFNNMGSDYSLDNYGSNIKISGPNYVNDFSAELYENKANPLTIGNQEQDSTPTENKFDWNRFGNVASKASRYAPAVAATGRLFQDFTPDETNFARQSAPTQVDPEQMSETRYDSMFNSAQNKATKDIINTSGGSGAAARANIAGSNANIARKKADAIGNIVQYNLGQRSKADYYNAGNIDRVNQANTGIANQEIIANEQNQAVASSNKQQAWNDFFDSVGGIGTEAWRQGQIDGMTPNVK